MSDIEVIQEKLYEFEITEDFSILFSKTNNLWFIEDYSEDSLITIIEDEQENILFEQDIIYKDISITKDMLNSYKKVVENAN